MSAAQPSHASKSPAVRASDERCSTSTSALAGKREWHGKSVGACVRALGAFTSYSNVLIVGNVARAGGRAALDLTGIVFELRPAPWTLHVVHTFAAREGTLPVGWLTSSHDARVLYGVTSQGGQGDAGSVFRLRLGRTGWSETIQYSSITDFDGNQPLGGVVTYECRLFGTNATGGPFTGDFFPMGTVFEVSEPH